MQKESEAQSRNSCVFEEDELPHMLAIFFLRFWLAKQVFDDEGESWDSCFQLKTSMYWKKPETRKHLRSLCILL